MVARLAALLLLTLVAVAACTPLAPAPTYTTPSTSGVGPLVVGDSITWQTVMSGDLQASHPDWRPDTYMGWRMTDVVTRIQQERDAGTLDTLVVALGTNDANPVWNGGWTKADEDLWTKTLLTELHPATHLVLVKPWLGPSASAAHRAELDKARAYIDLLGAVRANTVVVDWRDEVGAGGVLYVDDIHLDYGPGGATDPTPDAAAARIHVIERGLG